MLNRFIPFLVFAVIFAIPACGTPAKYTNRPVPLCEGRQAEVRLNGVPYTMTGNNTCAAAISPFDLSVWNEAVLNSRPIRGLREISIGCKPLTAATDNCSYCGVTGHSNTIMMNFDPTVYSDDTTVRRAVLAVHSPNNPRGLVGAQLRGRLTVGDELVSLARGREAIIPTGSKTGEGWAFFDVTNFVARAINERRNSIHFEISLPCQTPANNLVDVSVARQEPRLVVEFF